MTRRWPLLVLVALWPLLNGAPCTFDPLTVPDGGVDDGGVGDAGVTRRDVTFGGVVPGDFDAATIDGVAVTAGAWMGGQTVQVVDYFGTGQDLALECGTVTLTPPETHGSFSLIFSDAQDALLVTILDADGVSFTDAPINTISDAEAVGVTRYDSTYKLLTAQIASATRPIGAIVIASCAGYVHEVVLD
jgi:hypothetical protein